MNVTIRDIEDLRDIRQVEALQKEAWGFSDLHVVPLPMLVAVRESGGVLLGAFDGEVLAGFVFGFLGREGAHLLIHSQMLAVKPAYRGRGLGLRLKLAQRERVLAAGIRRITWTFDPLQRLNASLNFGRLGVVTADYRVNFYGESTTSFLHNNGTDRLLVTWPIASERVARRLECGFDSVAYLNGLRDARTLLAVDERGDPVADPEARRAEHLLIGIPGEAGGPGWREAARRAFTLALEDGYVVEEFCRSAGVYVLTRGKPIDEFDS